MKVAVLFTERLRDYDFGEGHPYRGDRYEGFFKLYREKLGGHPDFVLREPEPASEEDLLLVHTRDYVDFVKAASLGLSPPSRYLLFRYQSADNISPLTGTLPRGIEQAARIIVGISKTAGELVWRREFDFAIGIGGGLHHAKPSYGEGFCIYNDVAVCARNLLERHGARRILILDTDAHAGNGTCETFYEDPRVLFIDLHQDPRTLYPGTGFAHEIGRGEGEGFTVNIPMPPGASDKAYEYVLDEIFLPLAEQFRPEIIIRNGGCDPHFADGLTYLGMTLEGFKMIGRKVREAARICGCGTVDLITSGYNPKVLPRGWLALISGLTGVEIELEDLPRPGWLSPERGLEETRKVVEDVKGHLRPFWNV